MRKPIAILTSVALLLILSACDTHSRIVREEDYLAPNYKPYEVQYSSANETIL